MNFSLLKKKTLHFIIALTVKLGILHIIIAVSNRWIANRNKDKFSLFPFVKRRKHRPFQILVYHQVNDEQDLFFSGVPIKAFAIQMEMLAEYFNVLPLEELVERAAKDDVPPSAIAVTFDDGYRDNYENAYPLLKQYGLPATIFLATGALGANPLLWHDRVFDAFRRTKASSVTLHAKAYSLATPAEKRVALHALLSELRRCNPRAREDLIQQVSAMLEVPEHGGACAPKLRWREIKEMAQDRISFGAHTVTHPILTRMPLTEAIHEIVMSKEVIEQHLGSAVPLFAYPNGGREDFNASIQRALKEAGFVGAVTTVWGSNDADTPPYELRRVRAWGINPQLSVLRLGWYRISS